MLQYIAGFIGIKMLYNRAKTAIELKELKAYGEKVSIPYLGEDVQKYRAKLVAERDRRLLFPETEFPRQIPKEIVKEPVAPHCFGGSVE